MRSLGPPEELDGVLVVAELLRREKVFLRRSRMPIVIDKVIVAD